MPAHASTCQQVREALLYWEGSCRDSRGVKGWLGHTNMTWANRRCFCPTATAMPSATYCMSRSFTIRLACSKRCTPCHKSMRCVLTTRTNLATLRQAQLTADLPSPECIREIHKLQGQTHRLKIMIFLPPSMTWICARSPSYLYSHVNSTSLNFSSTSPTPAVGIRMQGCVSALVEQVAKWLEHVSWSCSVGHDMQAAGAGARTAAMWVQACLWLRRPVP